MGYASTCDPGIIPKLNLKYTNEDQFVKLPVKILEFYTGYRK